MTPITDFIDRHLRRSRAYSSALVGVLLALLGVSCDDDRHAVVSVELIEKGDSGNAERVLLVSLERPVSKSNLRSDKISIRTAPPAEISPTIELPGQESIRSFRVRIGSANVEARGVFSGDPSATSGPTGIGIDLGTGETWLDLLPRKAHPMLQRAVWQDRTNNLVVDRGDAIGLLFDREVYAATDGTSVLVPEHIFLTVPEDRLGQDNAPAQWKPGRNPREVLVELGVSPRLIPTRDFVPNNRGGFQPLPDSLIEPSGIAIHGTPLHPSTEIQDALNGLGAVSQGEIGIELSEDHPEFVALPERFPVGRSVESLTATTVFDNLVVLCGGVTKDGSIRGEVMFFDPLADPGQQRMHEPRKLTHKRHRHTATGLPGPDGKMGTIDDFLVIVGGSDGRKSIPQIEIVRFLNSRVDEDGQEIDPGFGVEVSDAELSFSRFDHAATALSGNRILITGGVQREQGGTLNLVAIAELLSFELQNDGTLKGTSTSHILPLPRMDHTATRLEFPVSNPDYDIVFVFGGSGVPRWAFETYDSNHRTKETYQFGRSVILGNPEILVIPSSLEREIEVLPLDIGQSYQVVRHGHRALALQPTRDGKAQVLVTGGSLRPVMEYVGGQWDVPDRPPNGDECSTSWRFVFNDEDIRNPGVVYLPSPTGETRVRHQLIEVPGMGALSLGGESATRNDANAPLIMGDFFLTERHADVLPFSIPLNRGRSGFAHATTVHANGISIFLFGGVGSDNQTDPLPDIEVLHLPRPTR